MSFEVHWEGDTIAIRLRGLDRLMCWRREVRAEQSAITAVQSHDRQMLESRLDRRVYGIGTHRGDRGKGRRRIGAFLGRDLPGDTQFWAVSATAEAVVALDVDGKDFRRIVVGRPSCPAEALRLL